MAGRLDFDLNFELKAGYSIWHPKSSAKHVVCRRLEREDETRRMVVGTEAETGQGRGSTRTTFLPNLGNRRELT